MNQIILVYWNDTLWIVWLSDIVNFEGSESNSGGNVSC